MRPADFHEGPGTVALQKTTMDPGKKEPVQTAVLFRGAAFRFHVQSVDCSALGAVCLDHEGPIGSY